MVGHAYGTGVGIALMKSPLLVYITNPLPHTQSSPSITSQQMWMHDCVKSLCWNVLTVNFPMGQNSESLSLHTKLCARIPAHLLMPFLPSCLLSPELDHYLLSLHIFAHASPSAWIFSFHVSTWQMSASLATLSPASPPRHREGLFQIMIVPSIWPIAPEYNPLLLHLPPALSSSGVGSAVFIFASRDFSKLNERVNDFFNFC